MFKKLAVAAVLSAFVSALVFAAGADTVVYITKTGAKYHRDGCSSLRKSKYEITLGEAVKRGYTPCMRCDPPVLTKDEPESKKKSEQKPKEQNQYQQMGEGDIWE